MLLVIWYVLVMLCILISVLWFLSDVWIMFWCGIVGSSLLIVFLM